MFMNIFHRHFRLPFRHAEHVPQKKIIQLNHILSRRRLLIIFYEKKREADTMEEKKNYTESGRAVGGQQRKLETRRDNVIQ